MKNKRVSVIVPVYNSEKYIDKCIESILAQDYGDVELVLIDDGSKDRSGVICKRYADAHKNIVYRYQDNSGVSSARNAGLDSATGEYIMFVDSDDRIKSNMISLLINEIERACADLCVCGYDIIRSGGITPMTVNQETVAGKANLAHYFAGHFSEAIASSVFAKLYKKSLINCRFCHTISMGEDLLFNLEYVKRINKITAISETLYIYDKTNDGSLTRNYKEIYHEQNIYVFNQWLNWFESFDQVDDVYVHCRIVNSYMKKLFCICSGTLQGNKSHLIRVMLDRDLDVSIKKAVAHFDRKHRIILNLMRHRRYNSLLFFGTVYCKLKTIRV